MLRVFLGTSPVVTIRTTSSTFSNSTFCPLTVFMCFVWISEQTAIISLYSINWLVCITETECVYCAVRTESLHDKSTSILRDSPHVICGGRSASGSGFSPSTSVTPVSIIPPTLHAHLHLLVALTRRTNGRDLGTFQKAMLLRKSTSVGRKSAVTLFQFWNSSVLKSCSTYTRLAINNRSVENQ